MRTYLRSDSGILVHPLFTITEVLPLPDTPRPPKPFVGCLGVSLHVCIPPFGVFQEASFCFLGGKMPMNQYAFPTTPSVLVNWHRRASRIFWSKTQPMPRSCDTYSMSLGFYSGVGRRPCARTKRPICTLRMDISLVSSCTLLNSSLHDKVPSGGENQEPVNSYIWR